MHSGLDYTYRSVGHERPLGEPASHARSDPGDLDPRPAAGGRDDALHGAGLRRDLGARDRRRRRSRQARALLPLRQQGGDLPGARGGAHPPGRRRSRRALLSCGRPPAGGVETLLLGLYGLFEQNQEALRFINAAFWGPAQGAPRFDIESFHAKLANAVTGIVADGLRAGELRPVDPGDVTHALIGLFSFSMDLTLAHPDLGRGRAGLERALDLLFRGLAAPAARHTENPS